MEESSMNDIIRRTEAEALELFKLNRRHFCSRIGFNPNKDYQPFCTYQGCTLYPTDLVNRCKSGCSRCDGFLPFYVRQEACKPENIGVEQEQEQLDLNDQETLHLVYSNQFLSEEHWDFSYDSKQKFKELELDYPTYTKINSLIAALKLSGNKYADKLNYITLTEMRKGELNEN